MNNKEKTVPWGTLVGIRPVKRVVNMLSNGLSEEETLNVLKNEYEVSDKKIDLSLSIAKRELAIIETIPDNAVSLYIDIPFCPSRCVYCSFASMPVSEMKDFIEIMGKVVQS